MFLLDHGNSILFTNKEEYRYFIQGIRENIESGVVDIDCCNVGQYYLGLRNPDNYNAVIEVVAVVKDGRLGQVE